MCAYACICMHVHICVHVLHISIYETVIYIYIYIECVEYCFYIPVISGLKGLYKAIFFNFYHYQDHELHFYRPCWHKQEEYMEHVSCTLLPNSDCPQLTHDVSS